MPSPRPTGRDPERAWTIPDRRFALEPGGPERIELSWEGAFKNLSVSLDGQLLGSFEKSADLKQGRTFTLSDGSRLKVGLATVALVVPELRVERDGEPLAGTGGGDPVSRLVAAATVIFFVAVLNAVLGRVAWLGQVQFLTSGAVIFRIFLLMVMARGFGAMRELSRSGW